MERKTGAAIIIFFLAALLAGCAKQAAEPAAPQLQGFAVTVTAAGGPVPAKLIVKDGADLNVRSLDSDITITDEALGIDTAIPTGEAKAIRVLPEQPGIYTLTCQGCPDGKNTISVEVQ